MRTFYGIGAADSTDGGITWGPDFDTGYGGPCSRYCQVRFKDHVSLV